MGFLQKDGLPDFSQAVISVWFRVPQASLDAALAQFNAVDPILDEPGFHDDLLLNMKGVVPLITFGPHGDHEGWDITGFDGGEPIWEHTYETPLSPSVIGIRCGRASQGSEDVGCYLYTRLTYDTQLGGSNPPISADALHINGTDWFVVGGENEFSGGAALADYITVTADTWHHVLISFDLNGSSAIGLDNTFISGVNFWWAFDDVNYAGNYLWPLGEASLGGAATNKIASHWGNFADFEEVGSVANGALPTSGYPLCIPGGDADAEFVRNVIMADVQIFTGVSINTSVEANRRAFITSGGHPASPSLAVALLGKSPEIGLYGTHGQWIAGTNLGTGGNLTPTGTISAFTPGPT